MRLSRELLEEGRLGRVADALLAAARPCVRLTTTPVDEASLPLGATKIGGHPDLPAGFDWPSWKNAPLSFLAQINLADLAAFESMRDLPATGRLYFFYDAEQGTWGYDPEHRESWRVLFSPEADAALTRIDWPQSLPVHGRYRSCSVRLDEYDTVPTDEAFGVEMPELSEQESEILFELSDALADREDDPGHHQVLGWPTEIQNNVQIECQLVSNGQYCGDSSGFSGERYEQLKPGAGEWRLLFQVDSDDNAQMMWGDLGRIYFMITETALRERDFDKVWMVLQCY